MTLIIHTRGDRNAANTFCGNYGPNYAYIFRSFNLGISKYDEYMKEAQARFNQMRPIFTHFSYEGKEFEMTRDGAQKLYDEIFGVAEIATVSITAQTQITYRYGRVSGEYDYGKTLLPTVEHDGKRWVVIPIGGDSKFVGDNVALTGGSKPSSYGAKNPIGASYYHQTFSAGGGRVTAGVSGTHYFAEGAQQAHLFAEGYAE